MTTDFQTVVQSISDLPPMPAVATKVLRQTFLSLVKRSLQIRQPMSVC